MTLKKANLMSAVALLLAAVTIVLAELREFTGQHEWVEFVLMIAIISLALPAALFKLKLRAAKRQVAKSTRDTVQKHIWELNHNREW